jgi:ribose transport system permease protein
VSVNRHRQLPVAPYQPCSARMLLLAVLVEPYVLRRRLIGRFFAWLRRRSRPLIIEGRRRRIEGVQTKGTMDRATRRCLRAASASSWRGAMRSPVILTVGVVVIGLWLRPTTGGTCRTASPSCSN